MEIIRLALWITFTWLFYRWQAPVDLGFGGTLLYLAGSGIASAFSIGAVSFLAFIPVLLLKKPDQPTNTLETVYTNLSVPAALAVAAYFLYSLPGPSGYANAGSTSAFADGLVMCEEEIPHFSLGPTSNPSQAQVAELCSCVWDNLSTEDKEISARVSKSYSDKKVYISNAEAGMLSSSLGSAIQLCEGFSL